MNKIEFPRIGVDGKERSKEKIERAFVYKIKKEIGDRLEKELKEKKHTAEEVCAIEFIQPKLSSILKAMPEDLEVLKDDIDQKYGKLFYDNNNRATAFGKTILECFNYENYREGVLIKHSGRLNVKCCPYCNQHYTLYIKTGDKKKEGLAKFQFDHFLSKAKYPYLSMSMYNLIPSCPTCNQSKSKKDLPLIFNPYHQEIADLFKFEIKPSIRLLCGGIKADYIKGLDLMPQKGTSPKDLAEFNEVFQIKAQYERHKDVAVEAYCRASINEDYLKWTYQPLVNNDTALLDRLVHGTYMENKNIEKRPLAKFYQDIYRQACNKKFESHKSRSTSAKKSDFGNQTQHTERNTTGERANGYSPEYINTTRS